MKLHKLNKFLEPLLTKFKEGKVTFFKGGFNFNLMKYNQNKCNAEFLEHLFSNNFILHTLPSRSTSSSQTLTCRGSEEETFSYKYSKMERLCMSPISGSDLVNANYLIT